MDQEHSTAAAGDRPPGQVGGQGPQGGDRRGRDEDQTPGTDYHNQLHDARDV